MTAEGPEAPDLASRRTIVREVLFYIALLIVVGGVFVALRVRQRGSRVFSPNPHGDRVGRPDASEPPIGEIRDGRDGRHDDGTVR